MAKNKQIGVPKIVLQDHADTVVSRLEREVPPLIRATWTDGQYSKAVKLISGGREAMASVLGDISGDRVISIAQLDDIICRSVRRWKGETADSITRIRTGSGRIADHVRTVVSSASNEIKKKILKEYDFSETMGEADEDNIFSHEGSAEESIRSVVAVIELMVNVHVPSLVEKLREVILDEDGRPSDNEAVQVSKSILNEFVRLPQVVELELRAKKEERGAYPYDSFLDALRETTEAIYLTQTDTHGLYEGSENEALEYLSVNLSDFFKEFNGYLGGINRETFFVLTAAPGNDFLTSWDEDKSALELLLQKREEGGGERGTNERGSKQRGGSKGTKLSLTTNPPAKKAPPEGPKYPNLEAIAAQFIRDAADIIINYRQKELIPDDSDGNIFVVGEQDVNDCVEMIATVQAVAYEFARNRRDTADEGDTLEIIMNRALLQRRLEDAFGGKCFPDRDGLLPEIGTRVSFNLEVTAEQETTHLERDAIQVLVLENLLGDRYGAEGANVPLLASERTLLGGILEEWRGKHSGEVSNEISVSQIFLGGWSQRLNGRIHGGYTLRDSGQLAETVRELLRECLDEPPRSEEGGVLEAEVIEAIALLESLGIGKSSDSVRPAKRLPTVIWDILRHLRGQCTRIQLEWLIEVAKAHGEKGGGRGISLSTSRLIKLLLNMPNDRVVVTKRSSKVRRLNERLGALEAEVEECSIFLNGLTTVRSQRQHKVNRRERLASSREGLNTRKAEAVKNGEDLRRELAQLARQITSTSDLTGLAPLESQLQTALATIKTCDEQIGEIDDEIARLTSEIDVLDNQLKQEGSHRDRLQAAEQELARLDALLRQV